MFNEKQIQSLKAEFGKHHSFFADKGGAKGLFIKVYQNGDKSWLLQYKDPKTLIYRRKVIEHFPKMSLKEARRRVLKMHDTLENTQSLDENATNESFFLS